MKAVVAAFNQEKALVGASSMITNLRMDLFEALLVTQIPWLWPELDKFLSSWWLGLGWSQGCSLFVTCAIMSHSWHLAWPFLRGHNKHSQPQIITAGVILTRVHCTFIAHAVLQVAGVTVYAGRHSHQFRKSAVFLCILVCSCSCQFGLYCML